MSPPSFFDTNVLVYAADADESDKQAAAGALFRSCVDTAMEAVDPALKVAREELRPKGCLW
jgi:predicted nucleic acid-binding protein